MYLVMYQCVYEFICHKGHSHSSEIQKIREYCSQPNLMHEALFPRMKWIAILAGINQFFLDDVKLINFDYKTQDMILE